MQLSVLVTSRVTLKMLFLMFSIALEKEASMLAARDDMTALLCRFTHIKREAHDTTFVGKSSYSMNKGMATQYNHMS